jgi:hypothetical protein
VAERVMAELPFETLLYGRVDLIRDQDGRPCVLELELTEPSLYLSFEPGSAQRFAAAALRRLAFSKTGEPGSRGAAVM